MIRPNLHSTTFRLFRRSRSIASTVLIGLLLTSLLFTAISLFSLLGFLSFQKPLSRLAQRTFPEATTKAQISTHLNYLLYHIAALHSATSHPARRLAYLDIEDQFEKIDEFATYLEEEDRSAHGPKIDTLKTTARELNSRVEERITAHSNLQEALGRLLPLDAWVHQQGASALSAAADHQKTTVADELRQISQLLEFAYDAANTPSLHLLIEEEKTLAQRLADMARFANSLARPPATTMHAIHQRLHDELLQPPRGLLPLAQHHQRLIEESQRHAVSIKLLVREKEEANIAGFFDLTSAIGRENLVLAEKVRTHVAILTTLFLTSMVLAITFFFYFRRVLIARLQKLNRQVLAMVEGERVPVSVEGADEISEIAQSVNYFAEEMHHAKESAEQAAIAKAEFLAHMSHEIRTPMNAILGFSELALNSNDAGDHRDALVKINTASHTLLGIVNTVLDYSKIEAGKFTIDHAPFDLRHLLENLATLISLRSEESGVEFYCQVGSDTPYALRGDGLRLGQVLTNLITNAFKFTEHGSVTLQIEGHRRDDERVDMQFEVHDTGSGIAEGQIAKLFQPFSQADTSMTRRHGGTGLGLAICKRLVEMMGGEIGYARAEDGGSIFRFSLPLLLEGDSDHTVLSAPPELAGKRVLVMSEVARTASELSCLLQAFGCIAVQALSPEEVRSAVVGDLGMEPFDVLVIDCPSSSHRREEILALSNPEIPGPAVIYTGARFLLPSQHPMPKAIAFLAKPILPQRLLNALLRALDLQPRTRATKSSGDVSSTAKMRQRLIGYKVLLVEDNDINRQVALGFLRAVGLSITSAANGSEALDILRQSQEAPFDLVLMDLQMPIMDGYSATQAIRRLPPPTCSVPILALTAHAMPEERDKCLRLGMIDLLSKPIDPTTLYDKLTAILHVQPESVPPSGHPPRTMSPLSKHVQVANAPAIDLIAGRDRVMGDDQLHRLLLRTFVDTYGQWWRKLQKDLAAGRFQEVRSQAHTIKGASGNLSMAILFEASTQLEQAATKEDEERCARLITEIEVETASLCEFLEQYLAQHTAETAITAEPVQ